MNTFKTQHIRDKYHINMQEEYVLGMISALEPMSTMRVLALAEKQNAMSPATTHKYLTNIHRKKLVCRSKDPDDRRALQFTVSAKGKHVLEEIKNGYVRG